MTVRSTRGDDPLNINNNVPPHQWCNHFTPEATRILQAGIDHMSDRASTYDSPGGERSMEATVSAFNAITGDGLVRNEERGWLFMVLLKMVRSQQGDYKADNYEDAAAYCGLMGEAAAKERGDV